MQFRVDLTRVEGILDTIDAESYFLDRSVTEFICAVIKKCPEGVTTKDLGEVLAAVLLDVYGSTEEVVHQVVDVEHWGKWDRFLDYKALDDRWWSRYKITIGHMFAYAVNGSYDNVGWDSSVIPNVDFVTYDVSGEINQIAKDKDIAFLHCLLNARKLGPKQKEMYVPVKITKKDGGQKMPETFKTFHANFIPSQREFITSTSNLMQTNTIMGGGYGGCVKINDLLTKTSIGNRPVSRFMSNVYFTQILPKEIWEQMGYPIIEL